MGEVVPARTSPTLHPPSPPTVHRLSWLALSELNSWKCLYLPSLQIYCALTTTVSKTNNLYGQKYVSKDHTGKLTGCLMHLTLLYQKQTICMARNMSPWIIQINWVFSALTSNVSKTNNLIARHMTPWIIQTHWIFSALTTNVSKTNNLYCQKYTSMDQCTLIGYLNLKI